MAVLPDGDRQSLWAEYMREPEAGETTPFTKAQLRAAVNAADDWVDSTSASFNSALPTAFRTGATARQKARLLRIILRRRFEVT